MTQPQPRAFAAVPINARQAKPRTRGLTEIRGPYYTPMGRRYLADLLETAGADACVCLALDSAAFALIERTRAERLAQAAPRNKRGGAPGRTAP